MQDDRANRWEISACPCCNEWCDPHRRILSKLQWFGTGSSINLVGRPIRRQGLTQHNSYKSSRCSHQALTRLMHTHTIWLHCSEYWLERSCSIALTWRFHDPPRENSDGIQKMFFSRNLQTEALCGVWCVLILLIRYSCAELKHQQSLSENCNDHKLINVYHDERICQSNVVSRSVCVRAIDCAN